jgi:hypothetical protein
MTAAASAARAEAYIGLGIGIKAPIIGSFGNEFSTSGSRHGRLIMGGQIGLPIGTLGLEGVLYGTELSRNGDDHYYTLSLGADLKYRLGLIAGLGAYVKAGLHHTWLQADNQRLDSFAGYGYALGAGIDYNFGFAALWLDYTHQSLNLESPQVKDHLEGSVKMLSLGASIYF